MKRKGSIRMSEIPTSVLKRLNSGEEETITLVEILAVDQLKLIQIVFPILKLQRYVKGIEKNWKREVGPVSFSKRFSLVAGSMLSELDSEKELEVILGKFKNHTSDIIRGYGAMLIGNYTDWNIKSKLEKISDFAIDKHSGVRELAWMSMRESFLTETKQGLKLLTKWTSSEDENKRRFASELSRPRGVWCRHSELLKQEPELGLPILFPLRKDPSRYVQNSVANWLNDASKSKPDFVREVVSDWLKENEGKETKYIAKRALRTVEK